MFKTLAICRPPEKQIRKLHLGANVANLKPKSVSYFSPISADYFIRRITQVQNAGIYVTFAGLGRKFGTVKIHLSPTVAFAAVRSKALALLLLIRC